MSSITISITHNIPGNICSGFFFFFSLFTSILILSGNNVSNLLLYMSCLVHIACDTKLFERMNNRVIELRLLIKL